MQKGKMEMPVLSITYKNISLLRSIPAEAIYAKTPRTFIGAECKVIKGISRWYSYRSSPECR